LQDVGAHKLNAYPGVWRPDHKVIDEEYKEGLYVGYRWVDKEKTHPLFAFGHGLSYTTFKLSDLRESSDRISRDGNITFTVNVKNTGKYDGAETVQLYIHDVKSSLDRPYKELKGFKKVELKAGESRDVQITIDNSALSFYDDRIQAWTSEDGDFEAFVGNASDNLPLMIKFKLQ
jgi:beta-glucosidase